MQAYRSETTVDQAGIVTVRDLPLRAGEKVEVIILVRESVDKKANITDDGSDTPGAPRQPGSAKGLIILAPDFDAPLEDFRDYTE